MRGMQSRSGSISASIMTLLTLLEDAIVPHAFVEAPQVVDDGRTVEAESL